MKNKNDLLIVNSICDQFEAKLKDNEETSIDLFLESSDVQIGNDLLKQLLPELIALKIIYSDDRNAAADRLLAKFPKQKSDIEIARHEKSLHGTVSDVGQDTRSEEDLPVKPRQTIERIGKRFQNLKHLASGGLGDVYTAFDSVVKRLSLIHI